jgi:hypothetical protein
MFAISFGVVALAIGLALKSGGMRGGDLADAESRTESSGFSIFGMFRPHDFDLRTIVGAQVPDNSNARLVSRQTRSSFEVGYEDPSVPTGSLRPDRSFDERFSPDQRSVSFDERFASAFGAPGRTRMRTAEIEQGADDTITLPNAGPSTAARPARSRSAPQPAPVAAPAATAGKRVRVADLSADPVAPADADTSHTAIYDVAAHTVYLPDGRRLEAHSGLGGYMDDTHHFDMKDRGPTPPNVYNLAMREQIFHGVRAIRLIPVDEDKMFGRDGMLAHSYMLGPNGQSNGCVSFSDYPAFLNAFMKGDIDRLVVVEHLANAPSSKTASGWIPEVIRDLFRRS